MLLNIITKSSSRISLAFTKNSENEASSLKYFCRYTLSIYSSCLMYCKIIYLSTHNSAPYYVYHLINLFKVNLLTAAQIVNAPMLANPKDATILVTAAPQTTVFKAK